METKSRHRFVVPVVTPSSLDPKLLRARNETFDGNGAVRGAGESYGHCKSITASGSERGGWLHFRISDVTKRRPPPSLLSDSPVDRDRLPSLSDRFWEAAPLTCAVAVLQGRTTIFDTVPSRKFAVHTASGPAAIPIGSSPTAIGSPGRLVGRASGRVTASSP